MATKLRLLVRAAGVLRLLHLEGEPLPGGVPGGLPDLHIRRQVGMGAGEAIGVRAIGSDQVHVEEPVLAYS